MSNEPDPYDLFQIWANEHGWELDHSPETEQSNVLYWWHAADCRRMREDDLQDRYCVETGNDMP